jgi:hypothetical protein
MDKTEFWKLIDLIDTKSLSEGDEQSASEKLFKALQDLPQAEIESFDSNLQDVLSEIEGEEYAKHAGPSGDSDDGFLYLRNFVVAQGQSYFENVKNNPSSIPDSLDCWYEELDMLAENALSKRIRKDNPSLDYKINLGECYEFSSSSNKYHLLVCSADPNHESVTFVPIEVPDDGRSIDNRLLDSVITIHSRKPAKVDKMLKLLGGSIPEGYFGISVRRNDLLSFMSELVLIGTLNFDPGSVDQTGGSGYHPERSLEEVIEHCLKPKLGDMMGEPISYKVPVKDLCH